MQLSAKMLVLELLIIIFARGPNMHEQVPTCVVVIMEAIVNQWAGPPSIIYWPSVAVVQTNG